MAGGTSSSKIAVPSNNLEKGLPMKKEIVFKFSDRLNALLGDRKIEVELGNLAHFDPSIGDLIELDDAVTVRVITRTWSLKNSTLTLLID